MNKDMLLFSALAIGMFIFGIWFGHMLGRVDVFAQCSSQSQVNLDAVLYKQATITCQLKPLKK